MDALLAAKGSENAALQLAHTTELASAVSPALERSRERSRVAALAASRKRSLQRSRWLRSPDCLLQVLTLVAFCGHCARSFSSLTRAFRGDTPLWGCIKDLRPSPSHRTSLMACCATGDLARFLWLLSLGADVHAVTTAGSTCLTTACAFGRLEMVRRLLPLGVALEARSYDLTPLQLACRSGNLQIMRALLAHGADVNAAGIYLTSLDYCCLAWDNELLRELLRHPVDVNAAAQGMTALMLACQYGGIDKVRLLLAKKASKTAVDGQGRTAYMYAPASNAKLRRLVRV